MFDILSLIGIPTTTVGVIWMLVRIGVWYWYNHTVGGKAYVARDIPCRDYSLYGQIFWPLVVLVTGLAVMILAR